jgi:hypothetical protein
MYFITAACFDMTVGLDKKLEIANDIKGSTEKLPDRN